MRAVVEYLAGRGERVIALSDYPDIFRGVADVEPFTRSGNPRVAHYPETMGDQSITQWDAMLRRAGLPPDVPLRIGWQTRNAALVERIRAEAAGRPLILVHAGRQPMQREDGYGAELMPKRWAVTAALDILADCYRVRIGNAAHLYPLPVDADLQGKTSPADLLDLASVCAGVVAQCSFAVPLAEALGRPLLAIWAAAGLRSATSYVRTITPRKVLCAPTSRYVVDDWEPERIEDAARSLRRV